MGLDTQLLNAGKITVYRRVSGDVFCVVDECEGCWLVINGCCTSELLSIRKHGIGLLIMGCMFGGHHKSWRQEPGTYNNMSYCYKGKYLGSACVFIAVMQSSLMDYLMHNCGKKYMPCISTCCMKCS